MTQSLNLKRFLDAQQANFDSALAEICAGQKRTHWMWFIFPQLRGLGHSQASHYYGITSLDEALAYLDHPVLGRNLRQCVEALLPWRHDRTAEEILGQVDAMKLRSSLTLFDRVEPHGAFARALADFFDGDPDERTLALLNGQA